MSNILGWTRARVLGASFGGMVAMLLALRHPHLVERLALLCALPGAGVLDYWNYYDYYDYYNYSDFYDF